MPRGFTSKTDVWRTFGFVKQWLSKEYSGCTRKPTELSHMSGAERAGFNGLIKPLHCGLEHRLPFAQGQNKNSAQLLEEEFL